ncbi:hypothetical protein [Fructobacillus ficulneus]|uniref:Uncharacterized protein n=1 Tax=Fructobacillus ficulneus TaxID=157463 RepID=A0A0K8MI99_9LACO|nr:hypothetical protein [Fructobacillus ficulneus]GAO99584.1 hypothetical protein FFIC_230680 [Fructobacillus ficulneus]
MDNFKITFTVDGQQVPEAKIYEMELSRYHKVFTDFNEKAIPLKLNGRIIELADALQLSLEDAREALAQTKEEIGKEGMLTYYSQEIDNADQMWTDIAKNSHGPMQQAIVEVETENISLIQFMLFNQSLAKENNLYLPSKIHPEHYYFEAGKGGTQTIVETFGMYKDPSYLHLVPGDHVTKPIKVDGDTSMVMLGQTLLMHGLKDTKIIGMHQLKDKPNGMKVKLGVFLPSDAPEEIIEGHKWHLMVEFNNGLHIAAGKHPNWLQKQILGAAIKKMAKKSQA